MNTIHIPNPAQLRQLVAEYLGRPCSAPAGGSALFAYEWTNAWGRVPRYALFPGSVTSRTDGQRHYIQPHKLATLYGVDLRDCVVVYEHELGEPWNYKLRELANSLPQLRPRYDGDYKLPAANDSKAQAAA